ncbi:MAG: cell division ATP-binding protein FtsE [Candidatus Limnocylindrales bacterium]
MPSRNRIIGAVDASVPVDAEPYVTFSHLRASLRPRLGFTRANAGKADTPQAAKVQPATPAEAREATPGGQSAFGPIVTRAVATEPPLVASPGFGPIVTRAVATERPPVASPGGITPTSAGRSRTPRPAVDMELPDLKRVALALHDVTKVYPTGKRALIEVDLIIPEGDFAFLVGPSGAGKSTLMKLLIRDELATTGMVMLGGQDLARLKRRDVPRMRRKIGIVFQDFKLLPSKTVRENVAFALEVTGTPRREIGPAVERVLALVGLTAQGEQRPHQLSGGEQQRTAIARAMVHDPTIVIADEPTGNLDPLISWEIIQLLLRINELGTTVLMATHNAEVVTALRRRVVALEEGRIVRDEVGGYHREY